MTVKLAYKPVFIRQLKKLPKPLQEEAKEKIHLFKDPTHHSMLKVHKISGRLAGRLSFSVNYRYRIIFMWEVPNTSAILLAIGDHSIYD
jgi:mRNA-degrading endonuclease RelE of RelBE toxin-antitoxin system